MTKPLFQALFNLRFRGNNKPLEDFLTEVFAFVLQSNLELVNNFLSEFKVASSPSGSIKVKTQCTYTKLLHHQVNSRPDMVVVSDSQTIFFEHKVQSKAGNGQIERYLDHLDNLSHGERNTLVYITKDYEDVSSNNSLIGKTQLIQLRWFQVYAFLKQYDQNTIVKDLLLFMNNNNLSMNYQFNPTDLLTLSNLQNSLRKMNETMFAEVSDKFISVNHLSSKRTISFSQVEYHNRYTYYADHPN